MTLIMRDSRHLWATEKYTLCTFDLSHALHVFDSVAFVCLFKTACTVSWSNLCTYSFL